MLIASVTNDFYLGRETRSGRPRILTLASLPCSDKYTLTLAYNTDSPRLAKNCHPTSQLAASICASQINLMPRPTNKVSAGVSNPSATRSLDLRQFWGRDAQPEFA